MVESDSTAKSPLRPARLVQFLVLVGIYGLLTTPDDPVEWIAGAIAAAVATAGSHVVSAQLPPWRLDLGGLARVASRLPRMIIESVQVSLSALSSHIPEGTFQVVPIDPGGDDARSVGRRGLVVAGASLAPNSLVVTLDRDHGAMLVHRLLPGADSKASSDREWPL